MPNVGWRSAFFFFKQAETERSAVTNTCASKNHNKCVFIIHSVLDFSHLFHFSSPIRSFFPPNISAENSWLPNPVSDRIGGLHWITASSERYPVKKRHRKKWRNKSSFHLPPSFPPNLSMWVSILSWQTPKNFYSGTENVAFLPGFFCSCTSIVMERADTLAEPISAFQNAATCVSSVAAITGSCRPLSCWMLPIHSGPCPWLHSP